MSEREIRSLERREVLKLGGAVVLGGLAGGCATATGINPAVPPAAKVVQSPSQTASTPASAGASMPMDGKPEDKPTYVAQARDPLAYSIADNLFWNDIMMEHSMFFVMLMPGPDNEGPRRQAEEFQRLFQQQLQLSSSIGSDNFVAFNRRSIDLAKRVSEYKKTLQEQQTQGKVRTLVWPLFFEHTAREADRFAARLAQYNSRQIEFERSEVIDFWSKTMGEHSGFIAHLLDPQEKLLIGQAKKLEDAFLGSGIRQVGGQAAGDAVMKAAQEVLDFKTVGEKGIRAGKIKSIIRPELASHVRREAVRFIDELKRAEPARA
jgi:hypothetical protein